MLKNTLAALIATTLATTSAFAQQGQDDTNSTLEEVTVTAQKREQSTQDVPISVQVFSAETMHKLGAVRLSDLQRSAPSFNVSGQGSGSQTTMGLRGIVDFSRNTGIDARMGVYIDGVYQGRSYTANQPLLGLKSVEILRGPQGTLFGKNTVSGAINMVTRKPDEEFRGEFEAGYGNYDSYKAAGYVSGQIADNFYGSVTASYQSQDGYYYNSTLDKDVGDRELTTVRGQLRWLPTDKLEIILAGDYSKSKSGVPLNINAALDPYNTVQNIETVDNSEFSGGALTANYSFDNDYTLTSITSFRHGEYATYGDDDYTPLTILHVVPFDEDSDQFSQEVRLVSPVSDKFDWVAGLYYFDSDLSTNRQIELGAPLFGAFGPAAEAVAGLTQIPSDIGISSFAAYVHGNYRFTEKLELTAGLRYTDEKKDVVWQQINYPNDPAVAAALEAATGLPITQFPGAALGAINYDPVIDDLSDSNWSPTIGLNYFFRDDTMAYVKYSRAYKSGGWNADFMTAGLENFSYDPESVDSYEIGLKTTTLNDTLRFNIAGFLSKFDDFQVFQRVYNSLGNPSLQLTNAAKVTVKGVELETSWVPTDRWLFNLNLTYADSTYDEFLNATGEDYSGNTLPYAPKWKAFVGAQYIQPLSNDAELGFNVGYAYTDEQYSDASNTIAFLSDDYSLLDGRIAYTPANGKWELALWGKNLTDKEYTVNKNINALTTPRTSWGVPRTYGLSFRYFFGG